MPYSTVDRLLTSYPKLDRTNATSATLLTWLERASHHIDSYLQDVVAGVPISPAPPLLIDMCEDIAFCMFLRRHVTESGKDTGLVNMWNDLTDRLEGIRNGFISIVNSAGEEVTLTSRTSSPWGSTTGYVPTFSILDLTDAEVDDERIEDEESIR